MVKNFALIGAAGCVTPLNMKRIESSVTALRGVSCIKTTGRELSNVIFRRLNKQALK
jgi:hypothetical protein